MAEKSNIEWTDATWNPVLGCDKISPGCKGCYAIRTAWRLQHNPNPKVAKAFEGLTVMQGGQPNWTGRVNFVPDRLNEPLTWKKPRNVFVNSQSDLFHEEIPDEHIAAIFTTMAQARQHTFQVLTKRPARMQKLLSYWQSNGLTLREGYGAVLPNVWLGVSVENQQYADERIPLLLQTPAAVRWISAEPLLGPIDFYQVAMADGDSFDDGTFSWGGGDDGDRVPGIDWVVAGGESGPNARPMHPDWARSLRDQCKAAGVPFFFKQWGEWAPTGPLSAIQAWQCFCGVTGELTQESIGKHRNGPDGCAKATSALYRVGKKAAGRKLDGAEHNEYPVLAAGERRP